MIRVKVHTRYKDFTVEVPDLSMLNDGILRRVAMGGVVTPSLWVPNEQISGITWEEIPEVIREHYSTDDED